MTPGSATCDSLTAARVDATVETGSALLERDFSTDGSEDALGPARILPEEDLRFGSTCQIASVRVM